MTVQEREERRTKLNQLLFRLARDWDQTLMREATQKQAIFKELEAIYNDGTEKGFRHYYSDIFGVLSQIDNDINYGDTEILSQNMEIVQREYPEYWKHNALTSDDTRDISKNIEKLYDHINLDIARINYSKAIESRSQDELKKVRKTLKEVEDEVQEMENHIKKAKNMQKEYITILGIFAAIVLAFTGGIAFSTSVLENIAQASIYRLVLVVTGLSFVLMNVIYLLTRFVQEILKEKNEKIEYPGFLKIFNILCAVVFGIVLLCWVVDLPRGVELFQNRIY